jgi:hypothetical protein
MLEQLEPIMLRRWSPSCCAALREGCCCCLYLADTHTPAHGCFLGMSSAALHLSYPKPPSHLAYRRA